MASRPKPKILGEGGNENLYPPLAKREREREKTQKSHPLRSRAKNVLPNLCGRFINWPSVDL